ncbi:hypothetical protein DFH08DRAFT_824621 [Mycena albidolilacea]|uniref:Uncharacterized protein n=1 Tax=Mycena albidolilacea TaxID=1033008 RepID=A0AAD6Z3J2_9AGAR|nr:hypothetical protein DFH08DRAFT_824621 [Mycena albidolilacea]
MRKRSHYEHRNTGTNLGSLGIRAGAGIRSPAHAECNFLALRLTLTLHLRNLYIIGNKKLTFDWEPTMLSRLGNRSRFARKLSVESLVHLRLTLIMITKARRQRSEDVPPFLNCKPYLTATARKRTKIRHQTPMVSKTHQIATPSLSQMGAEDGGAVAVFVVDTVWKCDLPRTSPSILGPVQASNKSFRRTTVLSFSSIIIIPLQVSASALHDLDTASFYLCTTHFFDSEAHREGFGLPLRP